MWLSAAYRLSMIFSKNRRPLFRIMLYCETVCTTDETGRMLTGETF
jgi:hypothetical protein